MSEPQPEANKLRPPKKRRAIFHGFRVLGLLIGLPVLFVSIGLLMMFDRDITAPSWIKHRVSERAAEALAGGSLEFGTITVNVGRDLHPRLRLTETKLRDKDGALIAEIDEIGGLLSPRGLVLERSALVQEVHLSGVEVALSRQVDGSVSLSFDQSEGFQRSAADFSSLMEQLDLIFEQPATVALEQVRIDGLGLTFEDERINDQWRVENGSAMLDLRGGKTVAQTVLPIRQDGMQDAEITANFDRIRGKKSARFAVAIQDANARDVAGLSPALSWMKAIDAPISASLLTSLDQNGLLSPLEVTLAIDEGVLQPNDVTDPLSFRFANVALTYLPEEEQIQFSELEVQSDWMAISASGQAILEGMAGGLPDSIVGQFELRDVVVNPPKFYDAPRNIDAAALDFRLALNPFKIDIGQAVVMDQDFPVVFAGSFGATEQGWSTRLDFSVEAVDHAEVRSWWPNGMKPKSRAWFHDNLTAGILTDVEGGIRIQPDSEFRYSLGFQFEEATVRILKELPPITGGRGFVTFVENAFDLNLEHGRLSAPQGGSLDFAGSRMHIDDFRLKPSPMSLTFDVSSTITASLSVLDMPPFEFMQKANLPVDVADGRADIDGTISFPLKYGLRGDDVRVDMAARLSQVASNRLIPDREFAARNLQLNVTNEVFHVSGPAVVSGVPFDGDYTQTFGEDSSRQLEANVELSQAFLDGFGIALPPGSVTGRGEGQLTVELPRDAAPLFRLTSDLQGVGVAIPPIGWSKPRSATGELLIAGALSDPTRIDRLDISGGGLSASGAVVLNRDSSLNIAQFSSVRLGDWLNAPITLRGRGNGQPIGVDIKGGLLDLRRAKFGGGGGASGPLTLALDRLQITEGIALTDFRGDFSGGDGLSGQFSGRVNGAVETRGTIVPQNGRSAVRLVSDDAGRVVSAAGFLKNASGGSFDMTLIPTGGEGTFEGNLLIRGLRVREAPAMAELLNAISVVGLIQQLDGQGLAFDEVDAQFTLSPQSVVVLQSSAIGPGLGISLDGVYTLASKTVDFQGVISPIYLLNGIGSFLTRKGEGLIGFNFTLNGSAQRPTVSVNPLSALTPGMFREIFRRPAPQVGQ